jgi:16S rRNA G966 N2-methylase RsmD
MTNQLYYGDSRQVRRDSIASESVDLVYLDPPFNCQASTTSSSSLPAAWNHKPRSKRSRTPGTGTTTPERALEAQGFIR